MRSAIAGFLLSISILACVVDEPSGDKQTVDESFPAPAYKDPQLVLHGDTEFTPEERRELQQAADMWRLQTSGYANAYIVWDLDMSSVMDVAEHIDAGHHVILRAKSSYDWVKRSDEADGSIMIGIAMPAGGLNNKLSKPVTVAFVVDRVTTDYTLAHVALHEFGHVFGVSHSDVKGSIMYKHSQSGVAACLKRDDLERFCKVNRCGTYKMYPCK